MGGVCWDTRHFWKAEVLPDIEKCVEVIENFGWLQDSAKALEEKSESQQREREREQGIGVHIRVLGLLLVCKPPEVGHCLLTVFVFLGVPRT